MWSPLLAVDMSWDTAGVLAILYAVGRGIEWLVTTGARSRKESRKDAIAEWERIVEGLRADRDNDRRLIHGLRDDLGVVKNRLAVCEHDREQLRLDHEWYLEALEARGIKIPHRPPTIGRYPMPLPVSPSEGTP